MSLRNLFSETIANSLLKKRRVIRPLRSSQSVDTIETEAIAEPEEVTTEPEATAEPDATIETEASAEPEVTIEPEATLMLLPCVPNILRQVSQINVVVRG